MRCFFKWCLRLLLLVLVLFSALVAHTIWAKPLRINWFYTRVFADFALDSPQLLSTLRILPSWLDFYSDKLDDASPAHELKLAQMIKDNYVTLQRYDRGAYDREGQLSYDVLGYFLSIQIEGDRFRFHDHSYLPLSGQR